MIYWSNKEPQITRCLLLFPLCPKDQYSYCTNISYFTLCDVTEKKNKYTSPCGPLASVFCHGAGKHIVLHLGIETALLLLFANPNPRHLFPPMSRRKYESPAFFPQLLLCAAPREGASRPWDCLTIQLAPASHCFLLYAEREE